MEPLGKNSETLVGNFRSSHLEESPFGALAVGCIGKLVPLGKCYLEDMEVYS